METKSQFLRCLNFGNVLKRALHDAQKDDRLVVGPYECAKALKNNPEVVDLCVLPEIDENDDVTARIHQKLVEAFCRENDINIVKVYSLKNFDIVFNKEATEMNPTDFSCLLIQNKK